MIMTLGADFIVYCIDNGDKTDGYKINIAILQYKISYNLHNTSKKTSIKFL